MQFAHCIYVSAFASFQFHIEAYIYYPYDCVHWKILTGFACWCCWASLSDVWSINLEGAAGPCCSCVARVFPFLPAAWSRRSGAWGAVTCAGISEGKDWFCTLWYGGIGCHGNVLLCHHTQFCTKGLEERIGWRCGSISVSEVSPSCPVYLMFMCHITLSTMSMPFCTHLCLLASF